MITNDKGLVELKHHVIREVCRQAWQGEITHDDRERIAREISPGPKPHYRCCVYREREIVLMRYGLEGRKELTQKEVACKMGISQSYISRLEKRIMLRLKKEILRQTCA